MRKWTTWLPMISVLALAAATARAEDGRPLVLATTTSVRDTGLMDELIPRFEKESGIHVQLVAVGSGAALAMGEKGDADVLLTHDPDGERALVERGALVDHVAFLENFFLIAGPPDDPAGVAQAADGASALRRIAGAKAPYASRGDDSGTHKRERKLFRAAGLAADPTWDGFVRTGLGMGATLQVAGEKRAYALSDTATFLAFRERTGLAPALDARTPDLRNVYAVSRPNPAKLPAGRVDVEGGKRLAAFLTAPATVVRIAELGAERGEPLFRPIAAPDAAPQ
ncbi:MAG: tungsten ABC transporter substrate-binding protein [Proteobacteria bacterium]|nr:MAG: tungsten ABC transporter substrate-binding protein [Pseudomonadota bacterium]